MRRFLTLLVTLVVFGVSTSLAQTMQVTGRVTSSEDKQPIPGANVFVKNAPTIGTMTDGNGNFTLKNIPSNAKTLVFRFVGYQTLELPITGNQINAALLTETQKIEEVVVVGYGSAKKAGTVVGSVATVKTDKIKEKPTANALDGLQGKVAGLQVYSSSGEPGKDDAISIRLHGVGSLGASSAPLFVLDGVPIDEKVMMTLNSNDFENVSILKDASATSIYGSRAANGVVYITSKKGKIDTKGKISVNAQWGFSSLANTDYFNEFMNTNELTNFWIESGFKSKEYVDNLLAKYPNDTKWYKYYYKKNAPTYQGDISLSGGGGKTTYYISGSYFFQDGLAARSEYEKYTFRTNITTKTNDWLSFGVNLTGATDARQVNPYGTNSVNRGLAMLAQPFYTPYDKDGNKYPEKIPGWGKYNPEYLADKNPQEGNKVQFNGSGYAQLNPVKGLILKTQVGMDAYDYTESGKRLPSFKDKPGDGWAREIFKRAITKTITNTAEYSLNILENQKLTALLGHEGISHLYKKHSGEATGFTDDRLMLLSKGTKDQKLTEEKEEYAYLSYFGRLDYNYDGKYFADFSLRRDGSSRFGVNNRYANFYAFGLMWNAKKESFLQNIDYLTTLNIKASYGTSGNSDIGNYQSLALTGNDRYDLNGVAGDVDKPVAKLQYNSGTAWGLTLAGNSYLGWEEQSQANLGLKFSLFEDRYRFNVEYYDRRTSNQLIEVPFPYTSGFGKVLSNVGEMRNSGIDLDVQFDILKGKDYYITPYFNFNYNRNEITKLFQGLDSWVIPNTGVCWVVNKPVSFYYPLFAGIDPKDGMPMWYKPGKDRNVKTTNETTKEFNSADLEQNTGIKRYAPFTGGFGFNAGWKRIEFSADFTFASGKYLINNDRYFYENPNVFVGYNQRKAIADYWKKEGDVTRFPKYGTQFTQFDSRLLEDASFIRLKTVSISYSLPEKILSKTKFFSSARFFMTGRNLLTFTDFSGADPEVDSNMTLGVNPNTKQYSFGVSLTF